MADAQVKTVGQGPEKAKITGVVIFVVLAFVTFYALYKYDAPLRWLALVVSLVIAIILFFWSYSGRRLWFFGRDSLKEMRKVVWPSRKESIQITIYVFIFVVVMALLLWSSDKVLEWIFYDLILGWKK